jgi:hypothetical protein
VKFSCGLEFGFFELILRFSACLFSSWNSCVLVIPPLKKFVGLNRNHAHCPSVYPSRLNPSCPCQSWLGGFQNNLAEVVTIVWRYVAHKTRVLPSRSMSKQPFELMGVLETHPVFLATLWDYSSVIYTDILGSTLNTSIVFCF